MNTSLQASGGRHLAPLVSGYPWRAIILEETAIGWRRMCVFECATEAEANDTAMEMCTEPYEAGVISMHFYVGEVA
jgi:hypothetical protein